MTTKQKVRVARRFARMMMDRECMASYEMNALYAPSECWNLIIPGFRRDVEMVFNQLGLSSVEFNDEMRLYMEKEAPFEPYGEPPMAYYEWMELEGLMN